MAIGPDKVRIQVIVDKAVAAKVEDLAARMRWSGSKMASVLLEEAIKDNEFVIRVVTSPFAEGVIDVVRRFKGRGKLATD